VLLSQASTHQLSDQPELLDRSFSDAVSPLSKAATVVTAAPEISRLAGCSGLEPDHTEKGRSFRADSSVTATIETDLHGSAEVRPSIALVAYTV